ncbi:hypothetical protein ABZ897_31375 [Nonomuraea sp. NPDC046802]|uniref:hypothetical protein n=1 Tax=Nonomuraea sp. NPDC046802 TaxID=3154919 RepID=UPI0033E2C3F0
MKNGLKLMSKGLSVTVATLAIGVALGAGAGAASAATVVKTYPNTTAGKRACDIDLKLAPAGYYCTKISNPTRWALVH